MCPQSTLLCPCRLENCRCHRTGLFSCSHTPTCTCNIHSCLMQRAQKSPARYFVPEKQKTWTSNFPPQFWQLLLVQPFLVGKPSPSCKATHPSSYQEGKDYIPLNDSHSSEDDGFSQVPSSAQQNSDEEDFDMRIRCHSLAARWIPSEKGREHPVASQQPEL